MKGVYDEISICAHQSINRFGVKTKENTLLFHIMIQTQKLRFLFSILLDTDNINMVLLIEHIFVMIGESVSLQTFAILIERSDFFFLVLLVICWTRCIWSYVSKTEYTHLPSSSILTFRPIDHISPGKKQFGNYDECIYKKLEIDNLMIIRYIH